MPIRTGTFTTGAPGPTRGVMAGAVVEHLYRAIRPLRIYEGTSEIQRTIIGRAIAQGGVS